MSIKRHWNYLKYVLRHKWFVFVEGRKLGVPLYLLILHDISKFRPFEWMAYAKTFYAKDGTPRYESSNDFHLAWLMHIHRNKHHWQYWILYHDDGGYRILEMPDKYRREMLADWRGAGRAQKNPLSTKDWYLKRFDTMKLNWGTKEWIEKELGIDHWEGAKELLDEEAREYLEKLNEQ